MKLLTEQTLAVLSHQESCQVNVVRSFRKRQNARLLLLSVRSAMPPRRCERGIEDLHESAICTKCGRREVEIRHPNITTHRCFSVCVCVSQSIYCQGPNLLNVHLFTSQNTSTRGQGNRKRPCTPPTYHFLETCCMC